MASINNCLEELTNLTKQNLNILKTLNSALTSDKMHLSVKVDDQLLAIPSFLSLENKINNLQENFNNLVNAPKTGEAYFNFDGNSQAIELRGFTHMPNSIELKTPTLFDHENNDIFKDFLTPIPYVNFELNEFPDDIVKANVRKIIPKPGTGLYNFFESRLESSSQLSWGDLIDVLELYTEDVHYTCYDKVYDLPVRNNVGTGEYIINEILDDVIDENLEEHLTIKFLTKEDADEKYVFTYKDFNYADKQLKVGDYLVTYNDKAKLLIEEIYSNDRVMKLKVINGEYLNLVGTNDVNYSGDYSKLKYFSSPVINKTIKVPLEEDKLIYVAIAPLNSRMNIQSYWGTGVIINTSQLRDTDGNSFTNYYKDNVKNIGDKLYELVMASGPESTKLTSDLLNNLKENKPSLKWVVTQINKHLNDTTTVKNIRSLYSQKKSLSNQLDEVVNNISNIETLISKASFDNEYDSIAIYNTQLTEYNKTKTELNKSINKIVNEIASAANNAEIPIENAKYHIRGYCEISEDYNNVIRGIKYRYRYKNLDNTYSQAVAVDDNFLFSDWTEVANYRDKELKDDKYTFKDDNSQVNEPSFNQVDIPISQGETVDVQVAYIYDYGYPYFEVSSDWSSVENISFPQEYLKDVQILDIITENNSDIELNRFESIINETGITEHIGDSLKDQDVTFYHKPENISSGYYTEERRVIPLKDKLTELTNLLTQLQDEVYGTNANSLQVSVSIGDQNTILKSFQNNMVYVEPYNNFEFPDPTGGDDNPSTTSVSSGIYTIESSGKISVPININLTNNTSHALKLFSLFPGSRDTILNDLLYVSTKYSNNDYTLASSSVSLIDSLKNTYDEKYQELKTNVDERFKTLQNNFKEYENSNETVHEYLKDMISESLKYKYQFKINIGKPAIIYSGGIDFSGNNKYQLKAQNIYYAQELKNDNSDVDTIALDKYFNYYTFMDKSKTNPNDPSRNAYIYQIEGQIEHNFSTNDNNDKITLLYFIDGKNLRIPIGRINNTNTYYIDKRDMTYYVSNDGAAIGNIDNYAQLFQNPQNFGNSENKYIFLPGMKYDDDIDEKHSVYEATGSMNSSNLYLTNENSEKESFRYILYDDTDIWMRKIDKLYDITEYFYEGYNLAHKDKDGIISIISGHKEKEKEKGKLLYETRSADGNSGVLSTVIAITLTKDDSGKLNIYNEDGGLDVKLCYVEMEGNYNDNTNKNLCDLYILPEYTFYGCKQVEGDDKDKYKYYIDYDDTNNTTIHYDKNKGVKIIPINQNANDLNALFKYDEGKKMIIINKHDGSLLSFGIQSVNSSEKITNEAWISFNNTWSKIANYSSTRESNLSPAPVTTSLSNINPTVTPATYSNNDYSIISLENTKSDIENESEAVNNPILQSSLDPKVIEYLMRANNKNINFPIEFTDKHKILYTPNGSVIDNDYYDIEYKGLNIIDTKQGIWYKYNNIDKYTYKDSFGHFETKTEYNDHLGLQTCNQFIYFRRINPYTGISGYELPINFYDLKKQEDDSYSYSFLKKYIGSDIFKTSNKLAATAYFTELPSSNDVLGAALYPLASDKYGLCISSDNDNYQLINPGQTITIPTVFEYRLSNNGDSSIAIDSIAKTLSFDLRPSLYSDPINYEFTVIAKRESTQQDIVQQQSVKVKNKYNPTIIG